MRLVLLTWVALVLPYSGYGQDLELDKEYFSTQKQVRVSDAIGKGRSKEIAIHNARIDAQRKALERSISSFRHFFVESKDFVVTKEQIIADINAKVIEEPRCSPPKWDHGMDFSPFHLAVMDCVVTVSFFDLDYFVSEIMKTAEGACIRSIVLSGWGQIYNKNYFSGLAMSLITYGSLGYGYSRENQVDAARKSYLEATDPSEAERRYRVLRDHQEVARTMYIIGAVTWAYSIWDAFEDRERADEVLYQVHQKYFKGKLNYTPHFSYFQHVMMKTTRPKW
ncbi:MAG: hypothetical protein ONA90_01160 [candidate division KSB1 bacterium]|nr:hypothetical protein [candidate division KSB1 bacterium]